jgi:hypothetical protein
MINYGDIIANIEHFYESSSSLSMLKNFERVLDELDLYVFDNWFDGELVSGPKDSRYFVTCTFMWDKDKMPDPEGGKKLIDYDCKVFYAESKFASVRRIRKPDDIRPGTRKGKIDLKDVWLVKIVMPKKLMAEIDDGYKKLERYRIADQEIR